VIYADTGTSHAMFTESRLASQTNAVHLFTNMSAYVLRTSHIEHIFGPTEMISITPRGWIKGRKNATRKTEN
jgi:hypothetical protein